MAGLDVGLRNIDPQRFDPVSDFGAIVVHKSVCSRTKKKNFWVLYVQKFWGRVSNRLSGGYSGYVYVPAVFITLRRTHRTHAGEFST